LLLNRPFIIILISLVTIKNKIYENRVSYKVIKASYLELFPPIKGRFKNTIDNTKFEGAIYLEYINAIYNIIYYNKPPYYLVIKAEIK
jgi:hypothetical protein